MASITSTGLGSGLDIESLVTKLMTVERQPITLLQSKEATQTAKLSSVGLVKASLSTLQSAASAISSSSLFNAYKASVADSTVASASVDSTAATGNYSIEVTALADVQKLTISDKSGTEKGFAALTSKITDDGNLGGKLTLSLGTTSGGTFTATTGKSVDITIDATTQTLQGMRDAINNAKVGVTATIVNDGGSTPYRLAITSNETGTNNTFQMSLSGGSAPVNDLGFDPTGTATAGTNVTKLRDAADTVAKVDSITVTSHNYVISGAIQGVTLTAAKTNIGSPTTLAVSTDTTSIQNKVTSFVKAYNDLAATIKAQTSYDSVNKKASVLTGDATVRSVQSQLRNLIGGSVGSGSVKYLSDVGIQFQKDGTLAIDSSKFQAALNDPSKDVASLFVKNGASVGIASQVSTLASQMISTGGAIASRTDGINATLKDMDNQIAKLQTRMTSIEARYRAQFTALDTAVASMNSTSSYLTQQITALANLAGIGSSSSK